MGKRGKRRDAAAARTRNPVIWVFCEGRAQGSHKKGTEEWYLSECKSPGVSVKIVPCGKSGSALVHHAQAAQEHARRKPDSSWLVFDKDDLGVRFGKAIREAEACGFRVAYSIECFEVWLILHFQALVAGDGRSAHDRVVQLQELIRNNTVDRGYRYEKSDNRYQQLYAHRIDDALRNAEKLMSQYTDVTPVSERAPSTNMQELVRCIRGQVSR